MIRSRALLFFAFSLVARPGFAESPNVTRQFYEVNGAKLYTETLGRGTPILFLHGGLLYFDNNFTNQRDYFAARHMVIGIDQRGHGHSPDGPWQLSYQQMADDTAALIRKLKVGPVDVVGHSDGGDIALWLARGHPDLVRRVVISGANLRGLPPAELEARKHWTADQQAKKLQEVAASLPQYFVTDYAAVSPDGADHWLTMVAKCYLLWSQSIVIEPAELSKITALVLVMAGDHDFTSLQETTEIFRSLPHAQLIVIPGTGHGTFQMRPELVNLAIAEFLERPDGDPHLGQIP
ncbi:MAG: alpha/beta hydrolase [Pseudomonadota bacterium]|nr:alpha/beta hydrolase [Pseudomonadota bacterium]